MPSISVPESLRALTARLPFGLDDSEQAGAAFRRWRECCAEEHCAKEACAEERTAARRIVDVWTYCFVRRYFLAKFASYPSCPASDLDELIGHAYRKIEQRRTGVREPTRYPHWVSVVCKNVYLNYVRRERPTPRSIEAREGPALVSEERVRGDMGLAKKVVAAAVRRLPGYLQPVARLRFLEARSYQAISRETGTAVSTARSYASRARRRLRADPDLQALKDLA